MMLAGSSCAQHLWSRCAVHSSPAAADRRRPIERSCCHNSAHKENVHPVRRTYAALCSSHRGPPRGRGEGHVGISPCSIDHQIRRRIRDPCAAAALCNGQTGSGAAASPLSSQPVSSVAVHHFTGAAHLAFSAGAAENPLYLLAREWASHLLPRHRLHCCQSRPALSTRILP